MCVFCGSSPGAQSQYARVASQLGQELVRRGHGLVYGGGNVGLMGTIADAVLEAGGNAIGVMPASLVEKEVAHSGLTQMHVVASMHERKALMADLSAGFIALPGGLGTLEELFEILTWAQLGFHSKPCGLLDVAGFYEHLSKFLDHCVDEKFLKSMHRTTLIHQTSPSALLNLMDQYRPPVGDKWIDRS